MNLNKNTKRNIKLRIDDGQIERTESFDNGKFETVDGYIFKNEMEEENDKNNLRVELKQFQDLDENNL